MSVERGSFDHISRRRSYIGSVAIGRRLLSWIAGLPDVAGGATLPGYRVPTATDLGSV
jgi:hypothetical protein